MKTQVIAGHEITLEEGKQYIAWREMAKRGMKGFTITIEDYLTRTEVIKVPGKMTYKEANKFLREFNNGKTSWDGRTW